MQNSIKTKYDFFFMCGIMILSLPFCSGENEEIGTKESDMRSRRSDSTSQAISPKKEYTRENSAEWESIASDHLPEIIFNELKSKDNITVKVTGRKFSERHYIEAIGIMDERSADIEVKYLERGSKPMVILSLNKREYNPEKIKVFVKCNLHDLWTTPLIAKEE